MAGNKRHSAHVGGIRAVADPPNAYGISEVRIAAKGGQGKVIGTIAYDPDGKRLWEAHPLAGDSTYEGTAELAIAWVLHAYVDAIP